MKKILIVLAAIAVIMGIVGISNKNKKDSGYHLVVTMKRSGPVGIAKNTDSNLKIALTDSIFPVKVVKKKAYVVYGKSNAEIELFVLCKMPYPVTLVPGSIPIIISLP